VHDLPLASALTVFDAQDSGCLFYGIEVGGHRWFVKKAITPQARLSLVLASRLHAVVRHPAIVRPERVLDDLDGPTLVYPWRDGHVLNQATTQGSDPHGARPVPATTPATSSMRRAGLRTCDRERDPAMKERDTSSDAWSQVWMGRVPESVGD